MLIARSSKKSRTGTDQLPSGKSSKNIGCAEQVMCTLFKIIKDMMPCSSTTSCTFRKVYYIVNMMTHDKETKGVTYFGVKRSPRGIWES